MLTLTAQTILKTARDLVAMPNVAVEFIEKSRNPTVSTGELAAIIERDPAMAVNILQAANSPLYGFVRGAKSIK